MATAFDRAAEQVVAIDLTTATRGAACGGRGPCLRTLPGRAILLLAIITLGGARGLTALLLAFIVVVQHIAVAAHDPGALVAIGLEAVLADQRTDTRGLGLDRIERVGACDLHVKPGAG